MSISKNKNIATLKIMPSLNPEFLKWVKHWQSENTVLKEAHSSKSQEATQLEVKNSYSEYMSPKNSIIMKYKLTFKTEQKSKNNNKNLKMMNTFLTFQSTVKG